MTMDDRPSWARRITAERIMHGWSQAQAVQILTAHALPERLPDADTMERTWRRWEAGTSHPRHFYARLLAAMFGTTTAALFPQQREAVQAPAVDTREILARIRASTLDPATLDGLEVTVDQLRADYPHVPPTRLLQDGREWLSSLQPLLDQRLTLAQHRAVLTLAGWLALLVGCVEYDMGDHVTAEQTRQAALSLGREAEHGEIQAWAHEMQGYIALTTGDYRTVITATEIGEQLAPHSGVAAQLAALRGRAWARIGDRRETVLALDKGRKVLEQQPTPQIVRHFCVDPAKYDFFAMECARVSGENARAELYAREVIQACTDPDTGTSTAPMRVSEALITLGVVAARRGGIEEALAYGHRALRGERRSLPHLAMSSAELGGVLRERYPDAPGVRDYLDELSVMARAA